MSKGTAKLRLVYPDSPPGMVVSMVTKETEGLITGVMYAVNRGDISDGEYEMLKKMAARAKVTVAPESEKQQLKDQELARIGGGGIDTQ